MADLNSVSAVLLEQVLNFSDEIVLLFVDWPSYILEQYV